MSTFRPKDMKDRLGEIVSEVIAPELTKSHRRLEVVNDIRMATLEKMHIRACEDQATLYEDSWMACAKALGFESLEALHAAGYSMAVNHTRQSIELRKSPGSPPSEESGQ